MNVRSKTWLEKNGAQVFGTGKARILATVAETGSLNAAARTLRMSYRHAWSIIRTAEARMGKPLLTRTRGGRKGGGAALTPFAKDLLARFDRLDRAVRAYADRRFSDIFNSKKKGEEPCA